MAEQPCNVIDAKAIVKPANGAPDGLYESLKKETEGRPVYRTLAWIALAGTARYMGWAGIWGTSSREQKSSQLEQKVEQQQTPEERYKSHTPGSYTFTK